MDHRTPRPEMYDLPPWFDEFQGMPYRTVGASGLRAPLIGLGTWKFGYPETGDGSRVDARTAFEIFDRAIELGVTHWDTANRYNAASGNSERLIGRWFAANPDQRRNVVLATKLCGAMDGRTPNHCGLSRTNILGSVQASLDRLQTDYIDILYFHRFDLATPIEESLETVEDLVRQGVVRYLAVSNFSTELLRDYLAVQQTLSRRCRPIAVQNPYNPLDGESDQVPGVLDFCVNNGIAFVPYGPLARGLLTGRYLDPGSAGPGDRLHDEGTLESDATEEKLAVVRRVGELADAWGVEISTLTLAYLLTIPGMGPQIPSSSSVAQLESNAAAGRLVLTDDQLTALREAFGR